MLRKGFSVLLIISVVLIAGCAQDQQQVSQVSTRAKQDTSKASYTIAVADQAIKEGAVTVAKAVTTSAGWVVIYTQKDDRPAAIIGHSPIKAGENANIIVKVDSSKATGVLYAMLHKDAGQAGVFEPPSPDVPITVGDVVGETVAKSFKVTI